MTTVLTTAELVLRIREHLRSATAAPVHDVARRGRSRLQGGRTAPGPLRGEASADLLQLIARRAAGIDAADPERPRKAFRIFLESVLLAEMGRHLVNDPGFHDLVERIHGHMESDAALREAMHTAGQSLLGDPRAADTR